MRKTKKPDSFESGFWWWRLQVLTKKEEFEWLGLFEDNKNKAQELQTQITRTEKEIDQMVYELYGLTDAEIQIVEKS